MEYHMERRKRLEKGEADPLGGPPPFEADAPELPDDPKQNLRWEREYLGFYLTDHPLAYLPQATSIAGLLGEESQAGRRVEVVGVVLESEVKHTRKGSVWTRYLLEDHGGAVRAFSFGEDGVVSNGYVGRAKGQLVDRDERLELKVFEFKLLEEW